MNTKRCYGCMRPHQGPEVCPHCGYDSSQPHATHQLPAGTLLRDQYLIGKVLGQGGFGITYLGWDLYLDIPVAIKEYYPGGTVSRDTGVTLAVTSYTGQVGQRFQDNKERFMREAKSLARFSDVPEIVQVKNFFQDNNTAYIVMEYVKGVTLKQYVKNLGGRIPADRAIAVLRPVLEALGKVHSAGLVHRDISPDNIMILPDGQMKLLDFGAVRDVGTDVAVDRESNRSTEAILKQGYAPIEQYQSRGSLGPWTDVYALCATIYYCITGQVPPDAPERLLGEERLPLDELAPELTAQQRNALIKGLELRAENRFASVNELYQALYGDAPVTMPVGEEPPQHKTTIAMKKTRGGTKSKKPLVTALAAVLVVAIVAVGVVALSGKFGKSDEKKPSDSTGQSADQKLITGQCGDDVTYSLNPKTGEITISGQGKMWDFKGEDVESDHSCPWEEQMEDLRAVTVEEGVTHIGANAFLLSPVETVTLSDTVESVGQYAFAHCLVLEEVSFGKALKTIENSAFFNCELERVELPDGVTTIGQFAFADYSSAEESQSDSLTVVKLGKSLESIGKYAFYGTAIRKVTLPDTLVTLGEAAFANCTDLEQVRFGASLKEIGSDAFYQCAITSAVLPDSLETIGDTAFALCIRLEELTFGSGLTAIGENCFFGAGIKELQLPQKLTTLGGGAFAYCESLQTAILPDGLEKLELSTFYNCPAMKSIAIGKNTTLAKETVGGVTVTPFNHQDAPELPKELVIQCEAGSQANAFADEFKISAQILVTGQCGDSMTWKLNPETGVMIISGTGRMTDFEDTESWPARDHRDKIRSLIIGDGVESIGKYAFYECENLKEISFGQSLKEIGYAAFGKVSVETLVIPDSVTVVGKYAFQACTALKKVTLSASLEKIDEYTFSLCPVLTEITLPDSVTEIGRYAFFECTALKNINFGKNIQTLGHGSFCKAGLETLVIPDTVTVMDNDTFRECVDLKQVTIGKGLKEIPYAAFYQTALETVTIPDNVEKIGEYAFADSPSIKTVVLGSVKELASCAFAKASVETLVIPATMENIADHAFSSCKALTTVTFKSKNTKVAEQAFYGCDKLRTGDSQQTTQDKPKENTVSGQCGDKLTYTLNLDTGAMTISGTGEMWDFGNPNDDDCGCPWDDHRDKIRSVTVEDGVESLGENAFSCCSALKTVSLGSVKEIGNNAFSGNSALQTIVIPNTVTTLGGMAFSGCSKLRSVTIGTGLKKIQISTFRDCTKLAQIHIPATVKTIDAFAFNGCTSLETVTLASSSIKLDSKAFDGCPKLQGPIYLDAQGYTLYFENTKGWENVYAYAWAGDEFLISGAWPGDAMTKLEGNVWSISFSEKPAGVIFCSGSAQTGDLYLPDGSENYYNDSTGKWTVYGG